MKKKMKALFCTAAALSLIFTGISAFSVAAVTQPKSLKVTEETEQITDIEVIRAMLTEFVEENNLDARIVSDKEYPGYQPVVVEFNLDDSGRSAWKQISEYIKVQNINTLYAGTVGIKDGKPILTYKPDAGTTTTTTTTTVPEEIIDYELIRTMLTKFVEDNNLEARIVSNKEYPGYLPVVVEFNEDEAGLNAWKQIYDYMQEQGIKYVNIVPIKDGVPILTHNNTTSTTTALGSLRAGDANCDDFCDVADAVLVARFTAEDKEAVMTDQGRENADVTHDGNVDDQDALKILQFIAKKISYEDLGK